MKTAKFSKILVCVDSSKSSHKALIKAIDLAEKFCSSLTLLIEERLVDFLSETEFKDE